jgi:hypothetical protein
MVRLATERLKHSCCMGVTVLLDTTANDGGCGPGGSFSATSRRFAGESVGVEDRCGGLAGQLAFDVRKQSEHRVRSWTRIEGDFHGHGMLQSPEWLTAG